MKRRTKIVATVGPQREKDDDHRTDDLGEFVDGKIPHSQLLEKFIDAGVDIIRLNMSFASLQESYGYNEMQYLSWLKEHRETKASRIGVIGDLPGPKIRLGKVDLGECETLTQGERLFLSFGKKSPSTPGATVLVNDIPFDDAIERINGKDNFSDYIGGLDRPVLLSIGDGKIDLRTVETCDDDIIICEVISDHVNIKDICEGKGLTIKQATIEVSAFQEADKKALDFLLNNGGELLAYIGVSFAQSHNDILEVKNYIESHPVIQRRLQELRNINKKVTARVISPGIIAKIETQKAWDNIDRILDAADGVMVARGDLGEQVPAEEVPEIQKELIQLCNVRGKVVITATQMLDSMEEKPSPTRAEATDVFNAILDGTDAVMLSGETSTGSYPIKAIYTMNKIAVRAEKYYFQPGHRRSFELLVSKSATVVDKVTARLWDEEKQARINSERFPRDAKSYYIWLADFYAKKTKRSENQRITDRICEAACRLSETPRYIRKAIPSNVEKSVDWTPKLIIVPTTTGRTAFMISRFRLRGCIIGAAHYELTYRKLLFGFGIQPILIGAKHTNSREVIRDSFQKAIEAEFLQIGDEVISTSGTPLYVPGTTNMIQLLRVKITDDE